MTLSERDRRALLLLGVGLIVWLLAYEFWPSGSSSSVVVAPAADSVALAEKRLARMRDAAATVPSKEAVLKQVSADLASREKGLINAETAAQAQAQLIQIVRRLATAENPPIEIRATEIGNVRPLGDSYGEATVAVQIDCRIDQLVSLLSALPQQPEFVTTEDLRVTSANAKDKTVGVRLTVAGVVPRRLVPQKPKNGGTPF